MPVKGSKMFALVAQNLEALADGVKRHCNDEGFPPTLSEAELRGLKKSLEDAREEYERLQSQADQAYLTYSSILKKAREKVSNAQRLLQGTYGFRSEVLKDFGLRPPKPTGRKTPKKGEGG